MIFEPEFEYGRDEKGHYVIRTSKKDVRRNGVLFGIEI